MLSAMKCSLAVALMLSLACSAYAIKCYQCESMTTPNCGLKFDADDSLILDCSRLGPPSYLQAFFPARPANATGCMKKTIESAEGHPQIVRTCYFGDVSNIQKGCQPDPSLPYVKQLSCDVCVSDNCNGSSSMAPVVGVILLFFGLSRMMA